MLLIKVTEIKLDNIAGLSVASCSKPILNRLLRVLSNCVISSSTGRSVGSPSSSWYSSLHSICYSCPFSNSLICFSNAYGGRYRVKKGNRGRMCAKRWDGFLIRFRNQLQGSHRFLNVLTRDKY